MPPRVPRRFLTAIPLVLVLLVPAASARAQESWCDSSIEDCRAPLTNLIRAERTGIDVAFSVMTDTHYAEEIIRRWTAGVRVRVLVDTRRAVTDPAQAGVLQRLRDAGIPMRERVAGGPLQWQMMLFAGQRVVQFGGAAYSARAFVPVTPYVDHQGSVIAFTDDPALVNGFMAGYDDEWTASEYVDRANLREPPARHYPSYDIPAQLVFSPGRGAHDGATVPSD